MLTMPFLFGYFIYLRHKQKAIFGMPLLLPTLLTGLIWLLATPLAGNTLIGFLEKPFQARQHCEDADALIVMAGGIRGRAYDNNDFLQLHNASLRRAMAGAAWLNNHPTIPAYIVGGYGRPVTESAVMAQLIRTLGVNNQLHVVEDAPNTRESAAAIARTPALQERNAAIMTSAYHMRRTKIEFQSVGVTTCAVATDFQRVRIGGVGAIIPNIGALNKSVISLHELLGILHASVT